ncbi:MAG: hypothetical protein V8R80_07495 [Eubacterium sp.]
MTEEGVDGVLVERIVIAGNTRMGHLPTGFSCETLGVYLFTPVDIGTMELSFAEMFGGIEGLDGGLLEAQIILMPGISTYVGADITAGMLSCEFDRQEKTRSCRPGTNGEMAIGNKDKIMVTSTAGGAARL